MRKVLRIAQCEYLNAVRTKAFIFGVALMPLLMGGAILVQAIARDKVDIRDRKFAVVDASGRLYSAIEKKAAERNERGIYKLDGDEQKQVRPRFLPERVALDAALDDSGSDTDERLDLALSDRVRDGELVAFVTIDASVLAGDRSPPEAISYYTETPTFRELPEWLEDVLDDEIRRLRLEAAEIDPETVRLVNDLNRKTRIKRLGLVSVGEEGEIEEAEEDNPVATFGVPAASMFLLFILLMMSSPQLLNTVLEEKMQKISELLVSAVSPFQLMLGKVLGTVLVAATLAFLYIGGLLYLAHHFGFASLIPLKIYFWLPVFLLLALLMYGSIFAGLGAACSELRDAQTLVTPAMIVVMIPVMLWNIVLESPGGTLSRMLSLFPPFTPLLMMLRIAISPGPAWWEVALSLALGTAFMLVCVWAGAKIFRIGLLSTGQAPTFRRLVVWVFSK